MPIIHTARNPSHSCSTISLPRLSADLQKDAVSRQQVSWGYSLPERHQQYHRLCAVTIWDRGGQLDTLVHCHIMTDWLTYVLHLMNAPPSHKRLSPLGVGTDAGLCLVHAALGFEPACIEVRIQRLSSPLQLASDITMTLCEQRKTRETQFHFGGLLNIAEHT